MFILWEYDYKEIVAKINDSNPFVTFSDEKYTGG